MKTFDNFILENKFYGKSIIDLLNWLDEKSLNNWIFIDTETTGLRGPDFEQLTQIAAIATKYNLNENSFNKIDSFNEKIKLTDKIKSEFNDKESRVKKVLSFNHYGQRGLKYNNENDTLGRFYNWVSEYNNSILVIQNAEFDMKMLNNRGDIKFNNEVIDTKKIIRLFYIPALQKLAETNEFYQDLINRIGTSERDNGLINSSMSKIGPALDIDMSGYHDALEDCDITIKMFTKIIDFLKENKNTDIIKYQNERIKNL